MKKLECWTDF